MILRTLVEADVSERYLSWFISSNNAEDFIVTAPKMKNISDLLIYVRERADRKDVIFLGIFDRNNGLHIGNIKFEPVNFELGYAIMGVLIGEPEYRGKGVATEVLITSARWLKKHFEIKEIILGVAQEHKSAIKAYLRAGFIIQESPHITNSDQTIKTMVLYL
jgi:ribosomal-protein-alanine N-acetyltransferase